MTTFLELSSRAMGQAHPFLDGEAEELSEIVEQTRLAGGPVIWRGSLTPNNIHSLGSLASLAEGEGAKLELTADGLDERQTAFWTDFETYGPAAGRKGDAGGAPQALLGAALETAFTLWQMRKPPAPAVTPPKGGKAVIIGAYGGDHVGDAAILGGSLLHLAKTHKIASADVLSHRPEHTARLAAGLVLPVEVRVRPYDPADLETHLADAALLAIAGGPVMDLPRMLVKHLAAAQMAKAKGIPFIIDRVGVGPFKRALSRKAARRLFSLADSIVLRTTGAGLDPVLGGLQHTVRRDPAFDYLATRKVLDASTEAAAEVRRLLVGTEGRLLIGVNLRPIRAWGDADLYRSAEAQFYQALASAMGTISKEAARPVTFVFFPMNPIEYGMSDLAAAWRLHKKVAGSVDLRVFEADPDVDDVLFLLRRLDAAMAMRFHAAIFALSQGLPTLGFDYYPGQGGKVEQLFADLRKPKDARRLDEVTADWIVERLKRVTNPKMRPANTK